MFLLVLQTLSSSLGCFISNCPVSKKRSAEHLLSDEDLQKIQVDQADKEMSNEQMSAYQADKWMRPDLADEWIQPYTGDKWMPSFQVDERINLYKPGRQMPLEQTDEEKESYLGEQKLNAYQGLDSFLHCPSNPIGECSYPGMCCVAGKL